MPSTKHMQGMLDATRLPLEQGRIGSDVDISEYGSPLLIEEKLNLPSSYKGQGDSKGSSHGVTRTTKWYSV